MKTLLNFLFIVSMLSSSINLVFAKTNKAKDLVQDNQTVPVIEADTPKITEAMPVLTEPKPKKHRLSLSANAFRPNFWDSKIGVRPRIEYDFIFPKTFLKNFSVGILTTVYDVPVAVKMQRTEIALMAGYWTLDRTLAFFLSYGQTSTDIAGYNADSINQYGLEARYLIPLSDRFELYLGAGWTHFPAGEARRDTGVLTTTSPIANAFCQIFTLGIANDCGTIHEKVVIPGSDTLHLATGLSFKL